MPPEYNLLQFFIRDTELFTEQNQMVINKKKTNILSFTKSRKWDFLPELTFSDGSQIECKSETKQRMLKYGLDDAHLFDVYVKEIRSILELAVPVWHSGLTKQQTADIERIQKMAFRIILQENYQSYQTECKRFTAQTLHERRMKLCSKFATKNLKSDKCMFQKLAINVNTRKKSNLVKEYKYNTGRFRYPSWLGCSMRITEKVKQVMMH